jgi:hypothetical protein
MGTHNTLEIVAPYAMVCVIPPHNSNSTILSIFYELSKHGRPTRDRKIGKLKNQSYLDRLTLILNIVKI